MNEFKQVSLALATAGLLASGVAQADLIHAEFYAERTRTFDFGSDVYFLRTSLTGSLFFNDTAFPLFPLGRPVMRLNNERFLNGVDETANMHFVEPMSGPTDWFVGSDNFQGAGTGAEFEVRQANNWHETILYFDNPSFLMMAAWNPASRSLSMLDVHLSLLQPQLSFVDWYCGGCTERVTRTPVTITSWNITPTTPVPEPETYAMMLAGLGLLGVMARRRKQKLNA